MGATPSMLVKSADRLPLEIWSVNRKIPEWDNTSLKVVVQRIFFNGRFLIDVARLKN